MNNKIIIFADTTYGYLQKINNEVNNIIINTNVDNTVNNVLLKFKLKNNSGYVYHALIDFENTPIPLDDMYIYELFIDDDIKRIQFFDYNNHVYNNESQATVVEQIVSNYQKQQRYIENKNDIEDIKLIGIKLNSKLTLYANNFNLIINESNIYLSYIKYINYRFFLFFEKSNNITE